MPTPDSPDTPARTSHHLPGDLDTDSDEDHNLTAEELIQREPGGLRKEQQQEQQPSKLQKLNARQDAPPQAGGEHPASLESSEATHEPERPSESSVRNHY